MGQIGISIVGGVFGGLITAVVVFAFGLWWDKILRPWIEDKVYQGIRVDGKWSLEDKTDRNGQSEYSQEEILELKQKAAYVTGDLILVPKEEGSVGTRTLNVDGIVRDGFVIIRCVPSTRRDLGYVTFLGQISGDGSQLQGQTGYYHIDEKRVKSIEAVYRREN
jgi:hypothetical protein